MGLLADLVAQQQQRGSAPPLGYRGTIDLSRRPRVRNADGTVSTVLSASYHLDGREVLLPLLSPDGRRLTDEQAIDEYRRTGQHLGIFGSPEEATRAAEEIHRQQAALIDPPAPDPRHVRRLAMQATPYARVTQGALDVLGHPYVQGPVQAASELLGVTRMLPDWGARAVASLLGLGDPIDASGRPIEGNPVEMAEAALLPPREAGKRIGRDELVASMPPGVAPMLEANPIGAFGLRLLDLGKAADALPPLAEEAVVRPTFRVAAGLATDPAVAAGVGSAARALGAKAPSVLGAAAGADRALAATGATIAGLGGAERLGAAIERLDKGKPEEAAPLAVEAILGLGLAGVGAAGSRKAGKLREQARAEVRGRPYVDDPRLTAAERAAEVERLRRETPFSPENTEPLPLDSDHTPIEAFPDFELHNQGVPPLTDFARPPRFEVENAAPLALDAAKSLRLRPGRALPLEPFPDFTLQNEPVPLTPSHQPVFVADPFALEAGDTPRFAAERRPRLRPLETRAFQPEEAGLPALEVTPEPAPFAPENAPLSLESGGALAVEEAGRPRLTLQRTRSFVMEEAGRPALETVPEPVARVKPENYSQAARILERTGSLKGAVTHLERLPVVGPEIAGRAVAYLNAREVLSGRWRGGAQRVLEEIAPADNKAQAKLMAEEFVPFLDGQKPLEALPQALQPAAQRLRGLFDAAWATFKAAYRKEHGTDPPAPAEGAYWPHVAKDASLFDIMTQARQLVHEAKGSLSLEDALQSLRDPSSGIIASRASRKKGFERARVDRRGLEEYRTDPSVMLDYFDAMGDRIAELQHLGKSGERVQALINRLPDEPVGVKGLKVGDKAFAQVFADRLRGVLPQDVGSQAANLARTYSGWQGLTMSWAAQPLAAAQTAAHFGPVALARGLRDTFAKGVVARDLASVPRLARAVRRSYRQAKIDAEEIAAVGRRTWSETAEFWAGAGDPTTLTGKASALAKHKYVGPWLGAMEKVDEAFRLATMRAAEPLLPKMVEAAKRGNAADQRALQHLGVDWKGYDGSPEARAAALKAVTDNTQYRTHVTNLPASAASPMGRLLFQFGSYMHQHTKTMVYLLKEAGRGNLKPIARYAAVGLPLAMGINELRDTFKGFKVNPEDVNEENFERALKEALGGKRRVDPTAGGHELTIAAARGLAALGVGAVMQAMLERAGGESLTDLAPTTRTADNLWGSLSGIGRSAGAAGKFVWAKVTDDEAAARAAKPAIREEAKKGMVAGARAVSRALPQAPIPGLMSGPAELVSEIASDKKRSRAGWAGRTRDALEEMGIIVPRDPSTVGAAGRDLQAHLDEVQARTRETRERSDVSLAPREPKRLDEKTTAAERTRLKVQFRERIIRAIESGDLAAAMVARVEAAYAGVPIGNKEFYDLMGRTYTLPAGESE